MFSSTFFTTHLIKNSIQMIMCVREVPRIRTYMNSPLLLFHIYKHLSIPFNILFYDCQKRFFMSFFTCLFLAFLFLLTFVVLFLCCFICSSIVNIKEQNISYCIRNLFWPENLLSEWVINLYDLQ